MAQPLQLHDLIQRARRQTRAVILDGGLGTELAQRGVDTAGPLWSARAIEAAPHLLRTIHEQYIAAGADLITANTFRTSRYVFNKVGRGDDAAALTRDAIAIARSAAHKRPANAEQVLVLGSVAPLEDCYQPQQTPDDDICRREHACTIETLLNAGVDGILIETMPTAREAAIAAELAQQFAPGRWMLSVICRSREPSVLLSGEPLARLLPHMSDAAAVGMNCLAAPDALSHVQWLHSHIENHQPSMMYANTGRLNPDGSWSETNATDPQRYAKYARQWTDAGATIIGGCCGTTPATIAAVRAAVFRDDQPACDD